MIKKTTVKIHVYDLIAAMVALGKKVKPADIANYVYNDKWSDIDKYDILRAVEAALAKEVKDGNTNPYGVQQDKGLFWLKYKVD